MNIFIRFLPAILSALMPALVKWLTIELAKPERRKEWLALASVMMSLHKEVSNDVPENETTIQELREKREEYLRQRGTGATPGTT